jgi:2-iminobutanoate/2-iminopropanoate deaminase
MPVVEHPRHEREEFALETSPPALSHYTDAVRWGDVLYISGCVALDETGQVVAPGDATAQATVVHRHLDAALRAGGTDFAHVLKVTVFLTDINDRQAVNEVRKQFFGDSLPASTLVEITALVLPGLVVEIEAIAGIPG